MRRGTELFVCCLALLGAALAPPVSAQTPIDAVENEGVKRTEEGRAAQATIDDLSDLNRSLLDDYRATLKVVDGLETYVALLDRQLANQDEEMAALRKSITDVAVIERQILPLLVRMIDALEQFITGDVPFLEEERRNRVLKLRAMLNRSDVSVAEKARRVFEAYQIENDYGRTIERYTGKLDIDGRQFDAEFLRVGRLALLYRTLGAEEVGYWHKPSKRWQQSDEVPWRRLLDKGLKVAGQEVAPELIFLQIDPAQVEALP
jgi:hypothetical protein